MRRRMKARTIIIIVGCVLALLFVLGVVPVWREQGDYCIYCMAHRTTTTVFGVHTRTRSEETPLYRYWLRNVDPKHEHTWVFVWSHTYSPPFGPTEFGDGYSPSFLVGRDRLFIALLRALPDRKTRLDVAEKLWAWDPHKLSSEQIELREERLEELAKVYQANPHRKDWHTILRRLRLL